MKKIAKNKKVIIFSFMIVLLLSTFIIPLRTYATLIDPSDYEPNGVKYGLEQNDVTAVTNKVNPMIGTIKTVGVVVAVMTIAVLGIKYMMGSAAEKSEYKKTMIPYLIGAVLIVAITQLLAVVAKLITGVRI